MRGGCGGGYRSGRSTALVLWALAEVDEPSAHGQVSTYLVTEAKVDPRKEHAQRDDRNRAAKVALVLEVEFVVLVLAMPTSEAALILVLSPVETLVMRLESTLCIPASLACCVRRTSCHSADSSLLQRHDFRLGSRIDAPVALDVPPSSTKAPHAMLGEPCADTVDVRILRKEAERMQLVIAGLEEGMIQRAGVEADE